MPLLPKMVEKSWRKGWSAARRVSKRSTPPAPLPYADEPGPRKASTRPSVPRSRWSRVDCPSGRVAGMPSTSTVTPRTPNCERAPKPRMEMRSPTAEL